MKELLGIILLGFLCPLPLLSQTNPNIEQGVHPFGSYDATSVDNVNLATGGLSVVIPMFSLPQRGDLQIPVVLRNSPKKWDVLTHCNATLNTCIAQWEPAKSSAGIGVIAEIEDNGVQSRTSARRSGNLTTFYYSAYQSDGSTHWMLGENGTQMETIDATGFSCVNCQSGATGVSMGLDRKGTSWRLNPASSVTTLEDANGNEVQTSTPSVDSMGRTGIYEAFTTTDTSNCSGPLAVVSASLMTVPGPSGSSRLLKLCYASLYIHTQFNANYNDQYGNVDPVEEYTSSASWVMQSAILYDGTSWSTSPTWTFEYNNDQNGSGITNFGDLTKITFPTGGSISYSYFTSSTDCSPTTTTPVSRWVSQRTINPNDGGASGVWTYSYQGANGTLVTDAANNDTAHIFSALSGGCNEYETQTISYSGSYQSNNVLKAVTTDYISQMEPVDFVGDGSALNVNVLPIRVTTTLPGGKVSKIEKDYDSSLSASGYNTGITASFGTLSQMREYDYGNGSPGALLRCTQYSYKAFQNSSYLTANMLDLPSTVTTYSGACGTGTQVAQTTYGYDELTLASSGISMQHDVGVGSIRGNLTSTSKWLNTTGGQIVSSTSYYDTGLPYITTDPRNNATTYGYSPAYYGAYLTQTTMPVTAGVNHVVSGTYDFNTGSVTSYTDQNSQVFNYSYDGLARLTTASFPDGGSTTLSYPDLKTIQKTVPLDGSHSINFSTMFDGLGRKASTTAPDGSKIVTTYDALGRIASVTNPFVNTSDSTYGVSILTYDALGRKTQELESDGVSQLHWSYPGNCSTSTNENSIPWTQCSDALGRLTSVLEPGNLPTSYGYDPLNNLLNVTQSGIGSDTPRIRSFIYDSLSRLTSATNPETGTIAYAYLNSNQLCAGDVSLPCSKTDARGVTSSYTYDSLNRLTQKSYSDGITPSLFYGYDVSSLTFVPSGGGTHLAVSMQNTIGRMAYASVQGGASLSAYSYDPVGRITNHWMSTPSSNTSGTAAFASVSTYDLAGNMTSLTYPDGRTVSQGYDGAGRMSSVSYTSWNGNGHAATYLSSNLSPEYDPAGHLINATLGSGTGLVASYDNRERIGMLGYGTSTQLLWGKQYQWTPNSNLQNTTDVVTGLQRQFGYDNLNRLTSAQDIVESTQPADPTPFPVASGGSPGETGGATPSWTDPNDSNLLPNPDAPGAEGWGVANATIVPGVAAPDGTTTASSFTAIAGSTDTYLADSVSNPLAYSGETMTGSVWLRSPNGTQTVNIYIVDVGQNGLGIAGWKQVNITTTWQQFQVSGQMQQGLTALILQIGGGGSVTSGQTISLWNPMMEDSGTSGLTVTNFLPYSQRLTTSTWGVAAGTMIDNSATAPDGTNTAGTVTSSGDNYFVDSVPNPAPYGGLPVTGSVWLRSPSGPQNILLTLIDVGSNGWSALGETTVALTSDWQRFQVSGTNQNTLTELLLQIGGAETFMSGQSVQVWGAQMELALSAGPYVATGASPVGSGTNLTNILSYSQQPNGPSWVNTYNFPGTPNAVVAPDGSQTGYEATTSGGAGWLTNDVNTPALYDNATLTGSVFLRSPSGSGSIDLYLIGDNASGRVLFQEVTAQVTSTWQRFTLTGQAPNGMTRLLIQIGDTNSPGQVIDVWGSQLELASTAGPYVATSALPMIAGKELTNILPNSQQLNGPTWGVANGTAALNSAVAPDGTATAATVTANSGSPDTYAIDSVPNPSLYDGQTVTGSVYLRVASGTLNTSLYLVNVGDAGWGNVGYAPVTLTTTWQRVSVTGTNQNGLTQLSLLIGGGGTLTSGQSLQIWGAQMVVGTSAAPYTPTIGGTTSIATGQPVTLAPNGLNESYSYDSFGNILQNGSFNTTYTPQNQMFDYSYDAAGNLLSNYLTAMTWDAESRLISAGGATYIYDAEGNRVEKQGVGVTDTIYFGGRPIARLSGGQWTDLIYGPNGLLAEVAGNENAEPEYRLLDHLGTQVGTVGSNGLLINPLDYTPFGQAFSGSTNDPYMFTGKERDAESGSDYFGARYYASNMGRFMSPDWADKPEAVPYSSLSDPQSLNLYAYARNNPIVQVDPDGHLSGYEQMRDSVITENAGFISGSNNQPDLSAQQGHPAQQQNVELAQNNVPPPPGQNGHHAINKDAITNYADQHAEPHSLGKCAAYCRRAFEAGGVDTNGHPVDAKDWGPTLLKNGASVISPDGYAPQKADVAVFAGSDAHPYGHITIYDGKQWVSDFKQRNMSPYRSGTTPVTIYRFPDN